MELTFGTLVIGAIVISSAYAIGRTIYEKWKRPHLPVEDTPAVIPFHTAVRLAVDFAGDRVNATAQTLVMVLPRDEHGDIAVPEQRNPGATTVDMQDKNRASTRPMGVAKVVYPGAVPA